MPRQSTARTRLLDTARDLIHARSYASASVEDLCAAAGINKGSFYYFFPSKLELYLEVVRNLLEQAEWRLERVANGVRSGAGPLEASRQYLGLADWGTCATHWPLMDEWDRELSQGKMPG